MLLPPPAPGIDFASLPWNLNVPEEHVYLHVTTSTDWSDENTLLQSLESSFVPFATEKLPLSPATTSL